MPPGLGRAGLPERFRGILTGSFSNVEKIIPLPTSNSRDMSGHRNYDIAFVGLKPGEHVFEYEVDDKFFAERPQEEFSSIRARVKMVLDKHSGFMLLRFEIGGQADMSCDRCGNPLTLELWDEFRLVVKMADDPDRLNEMDEDPDVFYISRTESHLNVEDWLYEFTLLSIPAQRFCPAGADGEPACDPKALALLRKMEEQAEEQEMKPDIWKGLDKFRNS
jgi:uncharacterized metal-binding protein YceD (DUF177 family)